MMMLMMIFEDDGGVGGGGKYNYDNEYIGIFQENEGSLAKKWRGDKRLVRKLQVKDNSDFPPHITVHHH